MSVTLSFSWPDHDLHPNARIIWQVKAKRVGEARASSYWTTKGNDTRWELSNFIGDMEVLYTFCPPDRAHRDLDNLIANMKPYLDGVMDALQTNDSQIKRVIGEWGPVCKGGRVNMILKVFDDGMMKF
jgi:hypothetical protein